ncbi:MAG: hypothetical protein IT459_23815 [Planctomycetes bacterium]|nr:hypothetical protein [Planctomycetota bacterium]
MTEEARARDRTIKTGPAVPASERLTVLDLLREMRKGFEERANDVFAQALLNERFIAGRQNYELGPSSQSVVKADRRADVSPVIRNQLRNLSLTWVARVLDSASDTRAWADKAGLDVAVAEVSNAYLGHQKERQDRQKRLAKAAMLALPHGSIYFKVSLDPDGGRLLTDVPRMDASGAPLLDEAGQPMMEQPGREGELRFDIKTIFDVVTDGAEEIEDATWALCRAPIDHYDAKALLMSAGITDEPAAAEDVRGASDEEMEGKVWAYELWHRPSARIPKGLFALVIGDVVVDVQDFPYAHGELPFACWKVFDRRDSQYGDTHITDTIQQQRSLNDLTAMLMKMGFDHGGNVVGLGASAIIDELEEGNKLVRADTPDAEKAFAYVTSPPPPQMLLTLIEMLLQSIPEGFGVNEVVASGGAPGQTKSARQLAYIKALDGQKLWLPLQNLSAALMRVDWQILQLAQQWIAPERMLEIVGEQNALGVQAFYATDLRTSIRLEAAPASEGTRAAQAANAEESAAAGFMDPARGAELRATGLSETAGDASTRVAIHRQVAALLAGEPVEPDPMLDAAVARSELQLAAQVWSERSPEAAQALAQLAAAYAELASESAAEKQQPLGQPSGAPLAEAQDQQQGAMP